MSGRRRFLKRFGSIGFVSCLSAALVVGWHQAAWGPAATADQTAAPSKPAASAPIADSKTAANGVPRFEWDSTWPKPLPHNWVLGGAAGVAIDSQDHIWVIHRPETLGKPNELTAATTSKNFGEPAPPVIEFDQAGNVVQAWGGPGQGYQWPETEHGVFVDDKDNVWISGSGAKDNQILKFTRGGKFLMQIGKAGQNKGSNDTENVGSPAGTVVDKATNEVWVADGYANRRLIAFDASTGAYKRHFGAYGKRPDDAYKFPQDVYARTLSVQAGLPPQFANPVHCVRISNDGFVYACDRSNGRIQVFRKDGTYVKEFLIWPRLTTDLAFSPDQDQRFAYVADFLHEKVWILRRSDMQILGSFGHPGHFGGDFTIAHTIAVDHRGNIYVGEVLEGRRVQRFSYKGLGPANITETRLP